MTFTYTERVDFLHRIDVDTEDTVETLDVWKPVYNFKASN